VFWHHYIWNNQIRVFRTCSMYTFQTILCFQYFKLVFKAMTNKYPCIHIIIHDKESWKFFIFLFDGNTLTFFILPVRKIRVQFRYSFLNFNGQWICRFFFLIKLIHTLSRNFGIRYFYQEYCFNSRVWWYFNRTMMCLYQVFNIGETNSHTYMQLAITARVIMIE